ncbi:MAG TPA: BamA/TamA family outer membrane protein [Acidobacteriota bacterium]|nr:BamA/TamA family outer membrane protein [Acidobacteriota bacterium]
MKSVAGRLLLVLLLAVCGPAAAERIVIGGLHGTDLHSDSEPLSIKLALSGGGARGLAAVGILRAFEQRNICITAIAGTSIGGIVGGLYACGYSSAALTEEIGKIDFGSLLSNEPNRTSMFLTKRQGREHHILAVRFDGFTPYIPRGLTTGQEVTTLLTSLTNRASYVAGNDFGRFPIPFKTIATDVVSGQEVVLDSGSVINAMRATMAFPLAFTGVEQGPRLLMDGGMVTPVPVDIVRRMGDTSALVVAVNTTTPLVAREELVTPVDIAGQVTTIMTADKLADQLSRADIVIEPCPDEFTTMDFKHRDSLIELGYRAGLEAADSIAILLHRRRDTLSRRIDEVQVATADRRLADRITAGLLGRRFTRRQLLDELKRLSLDLNLFETVVDIGPTSDEETDIKLTEGPVSLTVIPREACRLADVVFRFEGDSIFDDSTLAAQLSFTDSVVTAHELREGLNRIVDVYASAGYDLARIRDVRIDPECSNFTIVIDEARIRRTDVDLNERTKDWLVRSYFPLQRGDPYSTQKASRGIDNVYATDLFERVTLHLEPTDDGVILRIGVVEKKYTQVRLGWHWHDEYDSEQFVELLDDNVLGIGMEFLNHAQYGNERQRYFTELQAHRIFSTYLTTHLRLHYDQRDRVVFDGGNDEIGTRNEERFGAAAGLGQQIARLGTVTGTLSFEEIRLTDQRTGNRNRFGLRTLSLQSVLETFNRIPFPETGNKHLLEVRMAGKALGGDIEFTRLFSSLEVYLPLGSRLNYHPRLSVGISRTGLPASEKFYVGGADSFSGFRSDQLSGDKMLLLNQEVRLRLPLRLYLFARYDIGEVYGSADQMKLRNLRHGYGFAVALSTPIGPFEFGYGVVNRDTDRFHFNAGLAF